MQLDESPRDDYCQRLVRLDKIPEPAWMFFDRHLGGSSIPDHRCAYAHGWFDFGGGQ
ncbi:hypothetical protein [Paraburkholderia bannensis]|uniref:hypothetical protein n=1 Tax=Paraburkholderia bannensis TaxID=765414 RepID=UPI002AB1ED29|nr:hypothetical protein [Paraburkholderia bannensis]